MSGAAARFFGARAAAGLMAAAMLALLAAPARAGGRVHASDLPSPDLGAPHAARAGNQPSAPAATGGGSGHGVARPDRGPSKAIEDARKATGGDPGGDGA